MLHRAMDVSAMARTISGRAWTSYGEWAERLIQLIDRASHHRTTGCTGLDLVATPFVRGEESISLQQNTAVTCMAVKSTKKARIDQNWLGQHQR